MAKAPRTLASGETLAALLARVESSPMGLATLDAERRLRDQGPNEVTAHRWRSEVLELTRSVANPLALILLGAATASALVGELVDAAIIGVMVLLSAALNTWQTLRSARAVGQLQQRLAPVATVLRDRVWVEVPRAQIVVGDVIRLAAGDMVPADARLVEAIDLHVQQAALTGESLPAEKRVTDAALTAEAPDSPDLVFLGTSIVSGTATAVVFATGQRTAFGDVVVRMASRPDETEFERGTRRFGMLILETVILLVMFILIVNLSLGRDPLESLLFSVALAVGLTPEFLPMITTVTLAQGAVRMAREKVIVKHLSSIQNLGSIDILCSDKTGTLTAGTMTLDASLDPFGGTSPRALALAQLNSRFETGIKSPLDAAILELPATETGYEKTDELPFDFERRRLSVVLRKADRFVLVTKGAPESVLEVCSAFELAGARQPLDDTSRARCGDAFRALGARGYRVLAVAYREVAGAEGYEVSDESDLTFVGFLTFADHLLEGIGDSIARLRDDGVAVKILTGDNEIVSRHMCEQVGLDVGLVVRGDEVGLDPLP